LVFRSAVVTYYAPSDESGIGGIYCEHIHTTLSWWRGPAYYDCAFVNLDPSVDRMCGLGVIHILCCFSFIFKTKMYPYALMQWFMLDEFDEDSEMWIV
jgi:hypothetical protein